MATSPCPKTSEVEAHRLTGEARIGGLGVGQRDVWD